MSILIVSADFYSHIAAELLAGAKAVLEMKGIKYETVTVPGAFEIPGVIALAQKKYDGFIALGCVIRGETTHYDYVCGESARGLMNLSLGGAALGYGILTTETMEQAWIRADRKQGNKGAFAGHACLRMIELKKKFA